MLFCGFLWALVWNKIIFTRYNKAWPLKAGLQSKFFLMRERILQLFTSRDYNCFVQLFYVLCENCPESIWPTFFKRICANILAPIKSLTFAASTKKLHAKLLYEKAARKMLKLTPGWIALMKDRVELFA